MGGAIAVANVLETIQIDAHYSERASEDREYFAGVHRAPELPALEREVFQERGRCRGDDVVGQPVGIVLDDHGLDANRDLDVVDKDQSAERVATRVEVRPQVAIGGARDVGALVAGHGEMDRLLLSGPGPRRPRLGDK